MQLIPVQPIGDICFVKPEALNGIIQTLDERKALRGRIVACGPGRPLSCGGVVPMEVKVGDIVRVKQGQAIDAIFSSVRHWIVREEAILGIEE